jgi:hypothetical protein
MKVPNEGTRKMGTDAFGEFHNDIIDNYNGVNDINAFFLFFFSFSLFVFGRAPVYLSTVSTFG